MLVCEVALGDLQLRQFVVSGRRSSARAAPVPFRERVGRSVSAPTALDTG